MKLSILSTATILLFLFQAGCQAGTPTAPPSPIASVTIASTPTITLSPTPVPDPEIISPENASRLTLRWMNMGKALGEPEFSADGKWLYQESTTGIYAFDTISYQDVHLLETTPAEMLSPGEQIFPDLEPVPGFTYMPALGQTILSPDGSLIAREFNSDYHYFTAVWRLADGKLINRFEGRPREISPDSRLITVDWYDPYEQYTIYHVDLYDLQTSEQLGSWRSIHAFFLSDSQLVVEEDSYTRIFDPQTRKVPRAFPGRFAAFSPDEQQVAVLYRNRIHVYRVSDEKLLHNLDGGLPSTDKAVLRFSANGEILAGSTVEYYCCAGYSNRLFLWQMSDGRLLADLSQRGSSYFTLSPAGQTILIGSEVLRISDGSLIADLSSYFIDLIENLAFTPEGGQIVVATTYKKLYLYPVDGSSPRPPQVADPETYIPILQAAVSHPYPDDQIDVPSPDKKFLARRDKGVVTIFTWSSTGQLYQIPVYRVRRLAFSPDGRILALGLGDSSVVLWDMNSRQSIYTLPPPTEDKPSPVGGLAFSPDGKLLAVGLEDGTVRLFGIDAK